MSSSTKAPDGVPTAIAVAIDAERIHVKLADGRELTVPTEWFDWLASATDAQRSDFEIIEGGEGVWWGQLEDGISVPALFGLSHS
jgi:hypothetical protein